MNNSILANMRVFCTIDAKEFENGGGGVVRGCEGVAPSSQSIIEIGSGAGGVAIHQ